MSQTDNDKYLKVKWSTVRYRFSGNDHDEIDRHASKSGDSFTRFRIG